MVANAAPAPVTDAPLLVELALELGSGFAEAQAWRARAACRGTDVNFWHPQRGRPLDAQRAICRGCEVRVECLDYALAGGAVGDGGIWAGSSARQRRVAKRQGWDARQLLERLERRG